MRVPVMGVLNPPRVLDGAPVLLRSPGDFHGVGEYTVPVRAVQAVESLESVQVSQFVAVNRNVIPAARFGDAVDGKANGLIYGNEEIKQYERNNNTIDEGRG